MSVLKIEKFNSKVLRKKADLVKDEDLKEIVSNMAETMKESNGIGLAAPQIGISKQIIVIQPDPESQSVLSLINPKIISKGKERREAEEGCLSFPNIYLMIKRFEEIEVEALNMERKKIRFKANRLLARVLQHEIDHINGVVFMNRLSFYDKVKFKLKHLSLKF